MWRVWRALLAALWATAAARSQAPQPRCAHAAALDGSCEAWGSTGFTVKRETVIYNFRDGDSFSLNCPPGVGLDEPALPSFEPPLRVRKVSIRCPPPRLSYATALSALNVISPATPGSREDPAAPTYLIELFLEKITNLDPRALAAMPNLRNLTLFDTNFTTADLALLPAGLERLELRRTWIGRVPAAAFERLPRLVVLVVNEKAPVTVEAAGELKSLSISSRAALVSPTLPDALGVLTLWGWAPRRPEPWRSCAALETLSLMFPTAEELPDGWLAHCVRLRTLKLKNAKNLASIAAGALRNASALEVVWLSGSALETLPAGLLDHAPALRTLALSHNRLHTLPGGLFARSTSLSELYLTNNKLTGAALRALRAAAALRELRLDDNAALDACARDAGAGTGPGQSPLSDLTNLTVLTLGSTATRCVCADWRRQPRLARLALANTPITRLTSADFWFNITIDIQVDLYGTNVTRLELHREDYDSVVAAPLAPAFTLLLSAPLRCDCDLYWAAAALRHSHSRLRAVGARCEDRRKLRDVPLDELVCAAPGACAAGCACAAREDAAWPGRLLRLDCADAGLRRVPHLDPRDALHYSGAGSVELDLHLANNQIDRLGPEDSPPEITALDLRNNSLGLIDAATVVALAARADRRVLLAGNPLECGCRAAAALAAMLAHPRVFSDWADAACADGSPLALAAPPPCDDDADSSKSFIIPRHDTVSEDVSGGMSDGAVAALVLCSAVAIALGLALMRPSLRRRLWGCPPARPRPALRLERRRPDNDEWKYDAFESFAHADEAVVRELVGRLEGGAAPLRLCVHYRDWMPGGWIPTQIAASVRVSRRTVAVMSEAFLRSKWARAEFREAYAAALEDGEPRLVLVLMEDPARLPLDSELSAYMSGNTYVRWGDPWFWRKLRDALSAPAPRPPQFCDESTATEQST